VLLPTATLFVLADKISGQHWPSLCALVLMILSFAVSWNRIGRLTRVMAGLSVIGTVVFTVLGGTLDAFMLAASRALYLPALLTSMAVLQVATQTSKPVNTVARYAIDQPPGRRFWMLASAGHIFGILLNIGGYRLLLLLAMDQCRRMTSDLRIRAIQERRILAAIVSGFGATILWSPVGVAINLILPLISGFEWLDYAPYGLSAMISFVLLQFLFDRLGPRPRSPFRAKSREGVLVAILLLVALLVGITGAAALIEILFDIPMQGALLIVIPLAAMLWRLLDRTGPPEQMIHELARDTVAALPRPANEICLILSTGFLGLILIEIIPPDTIRELLTVLDLSPPVFAALIVVTIAGLSVIGLSPMITGTVLVGAALASDIAMPPPMLVLAALTGWSVSMIVSPVTATVAVTSGIMERPAKEIGLYWNGPFVLIYAALMMVTFFLWGLFL
jgi:hypothetical protein